MRPVTEKREGEGEREKEAQRNGANTHARTHAHVCGISACPTNAFKYRIWSTLPATRRWDCASVIFSILHSARVVSSISRGARTPLFVYLPPHSHSAFIPTPLLVSLHLYFSRLISSHTYIPSHPLTYVLPRANVLSTKYPYGSPKCVASK